MGIRWWRGCVSLALSLVATTLVSCRRPPRFVPVSQADRSEIASFVATLKHDPALFVVIRPDRLVSGTAAIEKLLRSLEPDEREALRRNLPDVAPNNPHGLQHLTRMFAQGVPKDLVGWDERRPILAALDGTGGNEDLSLLFRAFLADPGEIPPRALHHTLSIPATDSRALLGSLVQLLAKERFTSISSDAAGTAFVALDEFFHWPEGFVALFAEESAVRVEIVTDESPAVFAQARGAAGLAALIAHPPDAAGTVEPFAELAGSGADAVVVYLRTRNFFRREFVWWLGVVAQTRLLSDPAEKHSMLAKGSAELLGVYPVMSNSQARAGADVAIGLDLNQGVGVRIALHDDGAGTANERRAEIPLPIFDPKWYRTAATSVGIDGVPADAVSDILEGGGDFASAFVMANDPDRALLALAASSPTKSASARVPVRWIAGARPRHERTPGAECLARAARAMQSHFRALADWAEVANEERRSEQRLADLEPSLACAAADDRFAAQAKAIRVARTLVKAESLAAEQHRDDPGSNAIVVAKSAKLSPRDRSATETARSWLEAVMAGDTSRAVEKTALPFVLVVKEPYRDAFEATPGVVSTHARLLEVLGALTKFCYGLGCCETALPRADVHVRTMRSGVRIVSFLPNGYDLPDGTYFDVYIHVDASTGLVVRAVFEGLHTG